MLLDPTVLGLPAQYGSAPVASAALGSGSDGSNGVGASITSRYRVLKDFQCDLVVVRPDAVNQTGVSEGGGTLPSCRSALVISVYIEIKPLSSLGYFASHFYFVLFFSLQFCSVSYVSYTNPNLIPWPGQCKPCC